MLRAADCRSAVKISKSRSTEETTAERKSQEQNTDRDQCHYYNVTPTKTPSPGETGELHITKQEKEVALPVRDLIRGEGWFHGRYELLLFILNFFES